MKDIKCDNGCCTLCVEPYEEKNKVYKNIPRKKSGIIYLDRRKNKILLVQSRGNLWGFPKGTVKENEEFQECAIREFFEEKLSVDEDIEPYYPESGEIVRIRQLKRTGQVVDEQGGKFKISLDNIFYWVGPEELEQIDQS